MPLAQQLDEYIAACFTGLWVQSFEHDDAIREIAEKCHERDWNLASWDIDQGLQLPGSEANGSTTAGDPLAAIRAVNAFSSSDSSAILVLVNFHKFLTSPEVIQAMSRQINAGKQNRTFIVILAPVVQIPVELEKLIVVLEHELPDREQLASIAEGIAHEEGEMPTGQDRDTLLDAAVGLTRYEAESAFSLSLVREGRLTAETLWQQKAQMLKKSGLLSLYRGGEDFSSLGGLSALKAFTKRALLQPNRDNPFKRPTGVLLLSPPGCGKSAFCKALGKEVGRPVLMLDVGSLMGSLVGQSEERTRQALKIIDAMAPCVAMVDEAEKAFSGIGGQGDSGVAARMFGTFLQWLNDRESDVFVVCTSNDIEKLPPEFGRSERFDGIFFLDLPGREEKDAIWEIYLAMFNIDADQRRPDDTNFTGAEIKACCRLACLLDVSLVQAAQNVVPVAVTASESVERLRSWASGRCLSADKPGIYQKGGGGGRKARRKIPRDPTVN